MAVNKKTKSFSPYSYGVQYRHLGENPFRVSRQYVNAASLNEVCYTATKLEPKFNCFIENSFNYDYDGLSSKFKNVESKISIIPVNEKRNPYTTLVSDEISSDKKIYTDIKSKEFSVDILDNYFDYIALNSNNQYIYAEEVIVKNKENKIYFKFNEVPLILVLYSIKNNTSKYNYVNLSGDFNIANEQLYGSDFILGGFSNNITAYFNDSIVYNKTDHWEIYGKSIIRKSINRYINS